MSIDRVILAVTSAVLIVLAAESVRADPVRPRVRAADQGAAALLASGCSASATLNRLVTALDRTDVIVYVEQRWLRAGESVGATRFVTSAGGQRYLRITIGNLVRGNDALALLGHELQHAWEIARARKVVDGTTLVELYEGIGRGTYAGNLERRAFETTDADNVARIVRMELRNANNVR